MAQELPEIQTPAAADSADPTPSLRPGPAAARALPFLLLLLATPALASDNHHPFSAEDYRFHPFGWHVVDDGLVATGRDSGFAQLAAAPLCRRVALETQVVVEQTLSDDWNVATVAILRDHDNYWHFGLVDPPDSAMVSPARSLTSTRTLLMAIPL